MTTISDSKNVNIQELNEDLVENVENNPTANTEFQEYTDCEFTRSAIEDLGNRIRISDRDEDNDLDLFCYVRCSPEDNDIIKRCRGVVFHGNDIILNAFPYTVEYTYDDNIQIQENIQHVFNDCSFYDSHEGALIRMFNFSGRWYTSTHRKLNAFRSKWASKESFGTSFKKALEAEIENNESLRNSIPVSDEGLLERFQSILDTKKQYMFLVSHNKENRVVCDIPTRPTLLHVGTFVDGKLVMTENIHIPYPTKHNFSNVDQLINYVKTVNIRNLQGVIVFTPNNKQYKILHKDYKELFNARGNEPSIKYRYLQVRMDSLMLDMLYHLYPEMAETFDEYENNLYEIAKIIYNSYIQRFIKKKWVTLSTEEFNIIRECHYWHEKDRKQNRISLEKVIEIMNKQTPTNLNKMIRNFQNEKNKQQNTSNNSPLSAPSLLLSIKNMKTLDIGPPAIPIDNK